MEAFLRSKNKLDFKLNYNKISKILKFYLSKREEHPKLRKNTQNEIKKT